MTQELIYTSAPRGLRPGAQGFCTVVSTQGMPVNLAMQLEGLSGYRHLFPPGSPQEGQNPVAYSHLRLRVGGRECHVLSRIAAAGVDYSRRSNKLAHHVVLGPGEMPRSGPAWLLQQPGFMVSQWDGQVHLLPAGRPTPMDTGPMGPLVCSSWQQVAGDAGWAGILAETALSGQQAVLIAPVGMDPLPLIAEALQLLPPEYRWKVTFTTYYTGLPSGIDCQWRCVIQGTPEELPARRTRGVLVLDLTSPMGPAPDSPASQAAREGRLIPAPAPEPALAPAAVPGPTPSLAAEAIGRSMPPLQTPTVQEPAISGRESEPVLPPQAEAPQPPTLPPPPTVIIHGFRRKRRWWPWAVGGLAVALVLLLAIGIPLLVHMAKPLAEQEQVAQGPGDADFTGSQPGKPSGKPPSEKPGAKQKTFPKTPNGGPQSQSQPGSPADQSSAAQTPSSPPNEKEKKQEEKEEKPKPSPSPEKPPPDSSKPGGSGDQKPPGSSAPDSEQKTTPSDKSADPFQKGPEQPSEQKSSETTHGKEQPPQEKPSEKPSAPEEAPKQKPSDSQPGPEKPPKEKSTESQPGLENPKETPSPGPSKPSQPKEPPLVLVKPERRWLSIPSPGEVLPSPLLKIGVLGKGGRTVDSLQLEFLSPKEFKSEIKEKYFGNTLDSPSKIQIVCQSPSGTQVPFAEVILENDAIRFEWKDTKQSELRSDILEECLLLVKDTKHQTCFAIIQFQKPLPADKKQESGPKRGTPWPPLDQTKTGVTFSTKIPADKIAVEAHLWDDKETTPLQGTGKLECTFKKDAVCLQLFLEKTDQKIQWQAILTSPRYQGRQAESIKSVDDRLKGLKDKTIKDINDTNAQIEQLRQKLGNKPDHPDIKALNEKKDKLEDEKAGYEHLKQILESSKVRYRIYHMVKDSQGKEYRVYIGFSEGMEPTEE